MYVRDGKLYTWAGAREHTRKKNEKYKEVLRWCPACGDPVEAREWWFRRINQCPFCKRLIDWPHNVPVKEKNCKGDKGFLEGENTDATVELGDGKVGAPDVLKPPHHPNCKCSDVPPCLSDIDDDDDDWWKGGGKGKPPRYA